MDTLVQNNAWLPNWSESLIRYLKLINLNVTYLQTAMCSFYCKISTLHWSKSIGFIDKFWSNSSTLKEVEHHIVTEIAKFWSGSYFDLDILEEFPCLVIRLSVETYFANSSRCSHVKTDERLRGVWHCLRATAEYIIIETIEEEEARSFVFTSCYWWTDDWKSTKFSYYFTHWSCCPARADISCIVFRTMWKNCFCYGNGVLWNLAKNTHTIQRHCTKETRELEKMRVAQKYHKPF